MTTFHISTSPWPTGSQQSTLLVTASFQWVPMDEVLSRNLQAGSPSTWLTSGVHWNGSPFSAGLRNAAYKDHSPLDLLPFLSLLRTIFSPIEGPRGCSFTKRKTLPEIASKSKDHSAPSPPLCLSTCRGFGSFSWVVTKSVLPFSSRHFMFSHHALLSSWPSVWRGCGKEVAKHLRNTPLRTSLGVHWIRHHPSIAGDLGSIPGWGRSYLPHGITEKKNTLLIQPNQKNTKCTDWSGQNSWLSKKKK